MTCFSHTLFPHADNLEKNESLAFQVDKAVHLNKEHGWIGHHVKEKKLKNALRKVLGVESLTNSVLEIVKLQDEYQ